MRLNEQSEQEQVAASVSARELEICCETLQASTAAAQGGADRIELCAALGEGGVTPGRGLIQEVMAAARLPVHVLVRPRAGNFVFTDAEFRATCRDLDDALACGVAGVVVGLLTPQRDLDLPRMRELLRLAAGRPLTFHRAFDQVVRREAALEALIDLGCSRVLTSGGSPTVTEGMGALAALAAQARGRIRIAAGGGVTLANATQLTAIPGLDLHASLRRKVPAQPGLDPLWQDDASEVSVYDVQALSRIAHARGADRNASDGES